MGKLVPGSHKRSDLRILDNQSSNTSAEDIGHGVQRRMISVDNFFVFLRFLFFALLLLYVT